MKNLRIFICVICLAMFSSTVFAQEWSSAQKEVWTNVETYWDLLAEDDIEGFTRYVHSDFSGWDNGQDLPDSGAERLKAMRFNIPNSKTLFQAIKPLAIKIHGDVAIVHYSFTLISKYKEKDEKNVKGRWTDILMKQGDKWVMIGDHGGAMPAN
jgi:ketosteroid isomerase-like protein